jgi:hypothetical protein
VKNIEEQVQKITQKIQQRLKKNRREESTKILE